MGIFWDSWFLHNHEIPPQKKTMGKYEKPQRNDVNSTERSDILVFNCYLCHVRFCLFVMFAALRLGEILTYPSVLRTLFLRHLEFLQEFMLRN